ncbi:metallophosphoesterase family protein [Phormidium sp. FACHB-592]|uniref:Metallophosphoesterase family protein n=1 Tax=Stenomitos frigidus AS-A4 TaxID=2933935 RepID=A0ABV0KRA9_9CYAN|nr:metallophosphoesterase family protein [Phormidium sp. FACHB-592]MBD2077373.1 metallophosphoesterase family protein [Phormidium sp. FACHB-592]
MLKRLPNRMLLLAALAVSILLSFTPTIAMSAKPTLLTEPFLQLPTESSVRVVWFTEFAGAKHTVAYGAGLSKQAIAQTTQLSRTREDSESKRAVKYTSVTVRPIWRHEAEVIGLKPDQSVRYQVTSVREDGIAVKSAVYNLAAKPSPGKPLKILLTSDHQVKPMVAANLQKVVETVGQVDLVLFAGDLINVADRASEWFDDNCGGSFFPALQGRACYELEKNGIKTRYKGGAIIQNAPMYTAIGNHEVMGRFSTDDSLDEQFTNTQPSDFAEERYRGKTDFELDEFGKPPTLNPTGDPIIRKAWIKDHSFNTDTYEEIFSLPQSPTGGKTYYAVSFGDVRLVVLYITNVWRTPSLAADAKGKYRERDLDLNQPDLLGWGQHLFEQVDQGSEQYNWLEQELKSPAFQEAKYKVVMFHHPPHSLGENIVPAYTNPRHFVTTEAGQITSMRHEYPLKEDYIIRDVVPLLEKAKVQLVFYGHSHLWNRFISPSGMHFLETSNVGNSYGAFVGDRKRNVPTGYKEDYAATGDPNGLEPIVPTIAPLLDAKKQPMPYIASNDITAFSIFDTGTGTISSYRFDTHDPKSAVVKFDEFMLKK